MSRPILAVLSFKGKIDQYRRYARISTAFPRAVCLLMEYGQPGDVVEFSHAEFGFQIGTVKIHIGGRIDVSWTIEE